MLIRDRVGAALEQERVHARERRCAQLDGQLVHFVARVRSVQREAAQDAGQQSGREQKLVLVVRLQQRHGQPEELAEHGELVVLRSGIAEHFQVVLGRVMVDRGVAVINHGGPAADGTAEFAVVLAAVHRGDGDSGGGGHWMLLLIRRGLSRIVRHGITSAPEVRRRRLIEARGWYRPSVDRRFLRNRPLSAAATSSTIALGGGRDEIRVLIVQVRCRFEYISSHVQRSEIGFQRIHGRLQGQQQLRNVTLQEGEEAKLFFLKITRIEKKWRIYG